MITLRLWGIGLGLLGRTSWSKVLVMLGFRLGVKIREGKASSTTLRGVVIEVFFLNLYRDLEILSTRIRTKVLVN